MALIARSSPCRAVHGTLFRASFGFGPNRVGTVRFKKAHSTPAALLLFDGSALEHPEYQINISLMVIFGGKSHVQKTNAGRWGRLLLQAAEVKCGALSKAFLRPKQSEL